MSGIVSAASYLPYRRLDRSTIAAVAGAGGGKGRRTVASFDEDAITLGARLLSSLAVLRRRAPDRHSSTVLETT